jgi:hypothetical protein
MYRARKRVRVDAHRAHIMTGHFDTGLTRSTAMYTQLSSQRKKGQTHIVRRPAPVDLAQELGYSRHCTSKLALDE